MKSFDEKLETLYLPPRFSQTKLLNRIARRASMSKRNSFTSQIFEGKRERLESGDFLVVPRAKISRIENSEDYQFVLRDRIRKCSELSRQAVPPIQEVVDEAPYDMKPPETKETEDKLVMDVEEEEEKQEQGESETTREIERPKDIMEEETPKNDLVIKLVLPTIPPKHTQNKEVVPAKESQGIDKSEFSREDKTANIIFSFIKSRIKSKIHKIRTYWGKTSLLVPNVYRLVKDDEENNINFIEFQDYSKKELLVQSNGLRFKPKEKKGDVRRKPVSRKVSGRSAAEKPINNLVNCK